MKFILCRGHRNTREMRWGLSSAFGETKQFQACLPKSEWIADSEHIYLKGITHHNKLLFKCTSFKTAALNLNFEAFRLISEFLVDNKKCPSPNHFWNCEAIFLPETTSKKIFSRPKCSSPHNSKKGLTVVFYVKVHWKRLMALKLFYFLDSCPVPKSVKLAVQDRRVFTTKTITLFQYSCFYEWHYW